MKPFLILSLLLLVSCGLVEKPESEHAKCEMLEQSEGVLVKCVNPDGKVSESLLKHGKNGANGKNGPMGPRGPQGPTGEQGPSGEGLNIYETTTCAATIKERYDVAFYLIMFESMDAFAGVENKYMSNGQLMYKRQSSKFFPHGSGLAYEFNDGIFEYKYDGKKFHVIQMNGESFEVACVTKGHSNEE